MKTPSTILMMMRMSTMLMNDGNLRVESTQLKKFLQQAMESGPASGSLSSGPSVAAVEEPVVIPSESASYADQIEDSCCVGRFVRCGYYARKTNVDLTTKNIGASAGVAIYEEAIRLEMEALLQNGTWVEVKTGEVPCNTPVLRTKFVFG